MRRLTTASFAGSTRSSGTRSALRGGPAADSVVFVGVDGSGAPAGRLLRRLALSTVLSLLALGMLAVSSASAQYAHTTTTGSYGKSGTTGGITPGCHIAWHEATDRLYLLSSSSVYGLQVTMPGSAAPLGAPFPVSSVGGFCGDDALTVDNSATASAGNVYASQSTTIRGFSPAGAGLAGFPITASGETCGLGVTSTGQLWGGNYHASRIDKWNPDGTAAGGNITGTTSVCKIAVDRTNDDLYMSPWGSGNIFKMTSADNYTSQTLWVTGVANNATFTVNGVKDRLYVPSGATVRAFDTNTKALVETVAIDGFTSAVQVDSATDTLFVADTSANMIREIPGANIPKATTGDPLANATVSGTADPDGQGPITQCFFEWGPVSEAGYTGADEPCKEATPFATTTAVSADLTFPESEVPYRYRLVVCNANLGGCSFGAEKTITPHAVEGLKTGNATNITRDTATLHASFEGTGKDTDYYFEWGTTTAYGEETPAPPGNKEVNPVGLTNVEVNISGLTAGQLYHYRVVAENEDGISKAEDKTFTASPAIKGLTTLPATDIDTDSATLNGSLDPDGFATTYYFEWGKTTDYGQQQPIAPGDPVGPAAGTIPVDQPLDNLESGITYHYRIIATNVEGTTVGADQSFVTRQAPSINSFSSDNVTATSADLIATINPNGYDTTYYFEYGTTIDYGNKAPVPDGFIAAGNISKPVTVPISGLSGVTYHFRLIAVNQWGETRTPDQTFDFNPPRTCPNHTVRQQTGAAYLPDCRAYELVSPARAGGSALFPIGPSSAYASNPGRFAYVGILNAIPGAGEPPNGGFGGDTYVASRTAGGWVTKYVGMAGYESIGQSGPPGNEYGPSTNGVLSNLDMSRFLIWDRKQNNGFTLGGNLDGSYAPYVFDNFGARVDRWPTNAHEVPNALDDVNEGGFIGAVRPTPSFSHYVFSARRQAFAPEGIVDAPGSVYVNDTVNRTVTLVSKLPGGQPIPQDASAGNATEYIRIPAVSDDGSHVLMSTMAPGNTTHLYLTIDEEDHYEVSADHLGVNRGVNFEGMTADGSSVYFTTATKMTVDDTDTSIDLYRWSDSTQALTRVSDVPGPIGDTNGCATAWIGGCGVEVVEIDNNFNINGKEQIIDSNMARETGEIYFYSPELLDGARGFVNKRNLYVLRDDGIRHVATMEPFSAIERINVVPDGAWAAFITGTKLTSYDNAGVPQMYTYDAVNKAIRCVSCIPDGGVPTSPVEGSQNGRFLTDDGRAFFATQDALVDQDANGIRDIYEFVDSRPQLISSGTGESQGGEFQPTGLVGVSADGVDVFISTYETLVGQDENGFFLKFYDARTNGGFPFDKPPTPCAAADECHGPDSSPPATPQLGTTARLGDGGNLKPGKRVCKKRKKAGKKKPRCGKRKRANNKRGTRNG